MKVMIDFALPILAFNGKPIRTKDTDADGKEIDRDFILRDVAVNAVLFEGQGEKLDGMEKVRRARLADRIYGAKEPVKIDSDDLKLIKANIAKAYNIYTTGRAWELLDPEEPEEPETPEPK